MTATFLDPMAVAQIISRSRLNDSFSNTVWYLHADMSSIEIYIWFVGAIGVLVIASIHILRYCLKYRPPPGLKLPSGPRSDLPYIGKFLGIDTRAPWYRMKELCDIYGGIWQLISCGDMHVWIGDLKIAQDLLCTKSAIYSSRPMVPAIPGSDSQGQYLPLLAHNGIEHPHGLEDLMADSMTDHWRAQRKFAHTVLLQSSQREYYGYIAVEAKRYLYKLLMDPTDHFALTDRFCGRISSRLAYGRPDSAAAHCKNAFEFLGQLAPSGSVINLMPFLGSLPEWLIPSKKQVRLRREREENLWKGLMEQVRKDMDQGFAPVSYATTYINRRKTEKAFSFDDDEAAYAVGMLCTVSIFTIGGALYGFILAMVLHPEWQEKVREEVEGLLRTTKKDIIELSDSPKLPLLRASIKEYFRWRPVVPLGVPRLLEKDDEYKGHYLPKGAIIHAVELALARDSAVYPEPEAYNPGRWLEPGYPTYKEPLTDFPRLADYHGFGMGRRICVGIDITEAELLVACSALVWAFEMKPYLNSGGQPLWPDPRKYTSSLIGGPLPFQFDLQVRDSKRADKIKQLFHESEDAEAY